MRKDMMRWWWTALPLVLLGCEVPPSEAGFSTEDRVAVEAVMEGFAERIFQEDWEGAGGFFLTEAVIFPPEGLPVTERTRIVAAMEATDTGVDLDNTSLVTESVGGGVRVAYAEGSYERHLRTDPPEDEVLEWVREGSWLAVLFRDDSDEGWRIHRFMWNENMPPALPEELPDPPPPAQ